MKCPSALVLDLRSLALLRIVLGVVLLIDIFSRFVNFRAHYTSLGVLPLKTFLIQPDLSFRLWSVFYMGDSPPFVALLFGLFLLSALAFTAGYKTRYTGWVCWFFLVSLHHRNPMVLNAGDRYLALLLFWGGFLPWGETLSLDAAEAEESPKVWTECSLAGFCYLLQICFVYWFSSVLRLGPEWQVEGSALYYALSIEPLRTTFATFMLSLGTAPLAFFSFASLHFEEFGPILLLLPWSRLRFGAVFLIIAFHFGILLTLSIGVFTLVAMAAPLGLLPSIVWESAPGKWLFLRLHQCFGALHGLVLKAGGKISAAPKDGKAWRLACRIVPPLALCLTTFHLAWGIHWPDDKTPVTDLARVLSLDQRWGVFSPSPPHNIGWDSAPARTQSGQEIDLITGRPYKFPLDRVVARNPMWNTRWTGYHSKLNLNAGQHPSLYLQFLVKKWNQAHPEDQVLAAQFLFHSHRTLPNYLLGEERERVGTVYHR